MDEAHRHRQTCVWRSGIHDDVLFSLIMLLLLLHQNPLHKPKPLALQIAKEELESGNFSRVLFVVPSYRFRCAGRWQADNHVPAFQWWRGRQSHGLRLQRQRRRRHGHVQHRCGEQKDDL